MISSEELKALISEAVKSAMIEKERDERSSTLISREAAAQRLNVDVSTLWRWNKSGYLKGRKIGRSVWYTESSLCQIERGEREV